MERRTALRLLEQTKQLGYCGSNSRLTAAGSVTARSAFVPLIFEWGEAFQFDWSEEGIVIGGIWRKIQLAHMKLYASRAFWLVAYPSQSHEMLFDAPMRCLEGLGGVVRRATSTRDSQHFGRTICSTRASATWPPAGRRLGSRRACRIRGGGSGSRRWRSALAASPSSTNGW